MGPGLRRGAILDAAKRLFAARGYHATSMRDIAAALDLQGGSLYSHITSKEDLLWEIVNCAADSFIDRAAAVSLAEPDPAVRLRRLVEEHIAYMAGDIDNAIVFHHEWRFLSPARRDAIVQRRRAYEAYFRQAVEDGIRTATFAAEDARFATLLVLSAANWLYQWYRAEGPLSADAISARFNRLIERALRPCRAPSREDTP